MEKNWGDTPSATLICTLYNRHSMLQCSCIHCITDICYTVTSVQMSFFTTEAYFCQRYQIWSILAKMSYTE